MNFEVGSLVRARGREWVVLPESTHEQELLILRPLGGTDEETTGIYLPLERVRPAEFPLPDPEKELGNYQSGTLLREAVRLGFRSGAGPFRSLARLGMEPRPYQFVPLLMALKLDPVRLLIADDVGIGKTVEACLVARELLDRGEITRMTVLCPPQLADQWQRALSEQFHIEAELVLSSTAARLERRLGLGPAEAVFEHCPFTVVSLDYIKSKRRRDEFQRSCPEFVIVDEAHTCTVSGRQTSQQRHTLLQGLVEDQERHVVLVTATPHSGKEEAFRSLLSLLDPAFFDLPEDLRGAVNKKHREHLAQHFVQRRRGDLKHFLGETPFPERDPKERHYSLSPAYRKFFDKLITFCREHIIDETLEKRRQRVRWWSALGLLRSLGSSPAACAETLRNRAVADGAGSVDEADEQGRRAVLDLDEEDLEGHDIPPGSEAEDLDSGKMRRLAAEVRKLGGPKTDLKLAETTKVVRGLLKDGYSPILFCRYIPTVHYVADHLAKQLKNVTVEAVTGELPPEDRKLRVAALGSAEKRVLVCTDCLAEGINLQHLFDAVMHYDLSWNPTRHEQREGRVDRFGQPRDAVRAITFYGSNSPIDGHILEVLLRKHVMIHKSLGITVPVPVDTNQIVEAILEGVLLREGEQKQLYFDGMEQTRQDLHDRWDAVVKREDKTRTLFRQATIDEGEVARELEEVRRALGDEGVVEDFSLTALRGLGAVVSGDGPYEAKLSEAPKGLRDLLGESRALRFDFKSGHAKNTETWTRTHPRVEALSSYVAETALDPDADGPARRCAVVRTRAVQKRATVLLLRLRYHLHSEKQPMLAEDSLLLGFEGSPEDPTWLAPEAVEGLLQARPDANVPADAARQQLRRALDRFDHLGDTLNEFAAERGKELLDAHRRVRRAAKMRVRELKVEPHLPPDVLGLYVYLPIAGGAA